MKKLLKKILSIFSKQSKPKLIEGQKIRLHKPKLFHAAGIFEGQVIWIESQHILKVYKETEKNYIFSIICNSSHDDYIKNGDMVYISKEEFKIIKYT
tara:strand:+ start:6836 stop:7126 length:291 start_codon:yes stop_codon:yes gene_type:complete